MRHDDESAALAHQQQLEHEQMNKISAALVKAQKAFSPALKTSANPHFKSKYAALDACVEAVMDALNDAGVYLMQRTHACDDGVIVETIFIHDSGEQLSGGMLHFPATKSDAQGYMSALTYARRGSLMAACGIAPEDDDGAAASRSKPDSTYNKGLAQAAMNGCETFEDLKDTFAVYYKLAPAGQKAALKESYDNLKSKFNSTEEK